MPNGRTMWDFLAEIDGCALVLCVGVLLFFVYLFIRGIK